MRLSSNITDPKDAKLFFSNVSFNVDEIDIFDLFGQHGKINDIEILRDKSGRSRGSGYIEFEDPSSNQKAVNALNGKLYKDSILHVEIVQPNYIPDNYNKQMQQFHSNVGNDFSQSNIESQNKKPYFANSNLDDLPALPPPPPPPPSMYTMDQNPLSSRDTTLSAPPFMGSPDYQNFPQNNELPNNHQKKHGKDMNYSGSEYDYNYYNSDYYSSDYYYTNSESDEEQPIQNQTISQIPQVISPMSSYQLNSHLSEYDSNYPNIQLPLNPPPPLPPLPPIIPPLGTSNTLTPNSPSILNQYAPPPRNSGLPLPPTSILDEFNERNIPPQKGMIPPGYDIPNENDFNFGIRASASSPASFIQGHEHHHHRRSSHGKGSHRIHSNGFDSRIIDTTSFYHNHDEKWMVMPPPKDSPYWRNKRAKVIDELKKAAYEEIRKNSNEKGKTKNADK